MALLHNFWMFPPEFDPTADRILQERYAMRGVLPLQGQYRKDAAYIQPLLAEFCCQNRKNAIQLKNSLLLEAMPRLYKARVLRNGFIPSRGISHEATGVMDIIPTPEIPWLLLAIMDQPSYEDWRQLYELCRRSFSRNCYLLHETVLSSEAEQPRTVCHAAQPVAVSAL